eukprot:7561527-Alexandrium_andersonii.AAC.1
MKGLHGPNEVRAAHCMSANRPMSVSIGPTLIRRGRVAVGGEATCALSETLGHHRCTWARETINQTTETVE